MVKNKKIVSLYKILRKDYQSSGQWNLWCKRPKTVHERGEVMLGAILTQNTNWRNVEKAILNLKKTKCCNLKKLYALRATPEKVAPLIRSSGFYRQKTRYVLGLVKFVMEQYGGLKKMMREPWKNLRPQLLHLKGLGPETADDILLYALDRPVFVIDEYTRRLVKKYKISRNLDYHYLQKLFTKSLPNDFALYQDFHALIVEEGKSKKV